MIWRALLLSLALWVGAAAATPHAPLRIDVLEDAAATQTVEVVAAADGWLPLTAEALAVGFSRSAWWLRIRVPAGVVPLILEIDRPYLNEVTLFRAVDDGFRRSDAGSMHPAHRREIDYRHPVFRLTSSPDVDRTVYLRVASAGSLVLPLRVWAETAFVASVARENFAFGLYFGVVAIMALYNLFLYFGVRDRTYLWYVIYVAALGAFLFAHLGLAAVHWWPDSPWLATFFVYPAMAVGLFAFMQYVRALFGTADSLPRIDRALQAVAALAVLALLPLILGSVRLAIFVMYAHILGVISVSMVAGGMFWRRRFRPAIYFLLAFAVLWLAGIAAIARATGLTDDFAFLANHGVLIGSAAEILLLALALADRITLLKRDKDAAQVAAMHSQERALRAARESEQVLERRVAERTEALAQARDAAQQANRAKTGFLAAASHDLRQPMHALGLLVSALQQRRLDADSAGLLARIETSVNVMDRLLGALLDISRLDSGAIVPAVAPFPLQTVFDGLRATFEPEAHERGLSLRVRRTDVSVLSDPHLLDRILRNLVANAVRHTASGRVLVGVRREGGAIRIEVRDTGPGIPSDRRSDIFQEFVRLPATTPMAARGMGLGLSIVSRLCALLGHRMGLVSTPGRGSCFSVRVPRGMADLPEHRNVATAAPDVGATLRGRAILVIDDDPEIGSALRIVLEQQGCRVTTAISSVDAEARVLDLQHRLDALLVDYRLGAEDTGLMAIDRVTEILGESLPILMVTGETGAEVLSQISGRGYPVLFKPVDLAQLGQALAAVIAVAPPNG